MYEVWTLTAIVLGILAVERLTVSLATRNEAGREFIRRHWIFHPNTISIVRIPNGVISMLFWISGRHAFSVVWFSFWMITDLTDGTIARRCDLGTPSGAWIDPLSDKCMYFPVLLYYAWKGVLPAPWVVALVVIDTVGQASRLFVKKKAANLFGKAKTALITILLALTALQQIGHLPMVTGRFLALSTASCTVLAFLSFYCKVVPDLWYANSLTLANFICGLAAIWAVVNGRPMAAFVLVFLGQFFDLFDGRLARRFGSTLHGAIYDDIADATSFGLAIGFLIFSQLGRDAPAAITALVYLACTVFRLVRFLRRPRGLDEGIFVGLPSPAGAMLAGSSVLLFHQGHVPHALALLSAALMVSRIRYRHFGKSIWPSLPNYLKLLGFIAVLIFLNNSIAHRQTDAFALLMFAMAVLYAVAGVSYRDIGPGRRRRMPEPTAE